MRYEKVSYVRVKEVLFEFPFLQRMIQLINYIDSIERTKILRKMIDKFFVTFHDGKLRESQLFNFKF